MPVSRRALVGGAVALGAVVVFVATSRHGRPAGRPVEEAAEVAPSAESARWIEAQRGAAAVAVAAAARATEAPPTAAGTPRPELAGMASCEGLQLRDVEVRKDDTLVWLTDGANTQSVSIGKEFRGLTVLGAQPAANDAEAVAWLRRADGSMCRTASRIEQLQRNMEKLARGISVEDIAAAHNMSAALRPTMAPIEPQVAGALLAAVQGAAPADAQTKTK
jgi:hypothetical protein